MFAGYCERNFGGMRSRRSPKLLQIFEKHALFGEKDAESEGEDDMRPIDEDMSPEIFADHDEAPEENDIYFDGYTAKDHELLAIEEYIEGLEIGLLSTVNFLNGLPGFLDAVIKKLQEQQNQIYYLANKIEELEKIIYAK